MDFGYRWQNSQVIIHRDSVVKDEKGIVDQQGNTWTEWSRHVLKELERLNYNYEIISKEIQFIRPDRERMEEIKMWKSAFEREISVAELKTIRLDLQSIKTFKTQAVTIWAVVQIIMGILQFYMTRH